MIVSADIPDVLVSKIDALVINNEPPVWPFEKKTVVPDALSRADREKLEKYQTEYAAFESANRDGTSLRSRSAVVRKILFAYFGEPHQS